MSGAIATGTTTLHPKFLHFCISASVRGGKSTTKHRPKLCDSMSIHFLTSVHRLPIRPKPRAHLPYHAAPPTSITLLHHLHTSLITSCIICATFRQFDATLIQMEHFFVHLRIQLRHMCLHKERILGRRSRGNRHQFRPRDPPQRISPVPGSSCTTGSHNGGPVRRRRET